MGFLKALGKLGKATVGTVLLPIDVLRDAVPDFDAEPFENTAKRGRKIGRNLRDAFNEIDED